MSKFIKLDINEKVMQKDTWKLEPPTEKQIKAIENISSCLKHCCELPKNKGEAAKLITKLKREMQNKIIVDSYGVSQYPDEDYDDIEYSMYVNSNFDCF